MFYESPRFWIRSVAPIPSFPRCPDCGAEAHELTFRPGVRQVDGQTDEGPTVYDERELIDFAWRCPSDQLLRRRLVTLSSTAGSA
jgi:hypothetical protein